MAIALQRQLSPGNFLVWVTITVVGDTKVMTCTLHIKGQPDGETIGGTAVYSDHGESGLSHSRYYGYARLE